MQIHFGAKDAPTRPDWKGQNAFVVVKKYAENKLIQQDITLCEVTDVQGHQGKKIQGIQAKPFDRDNVDLLTLTPLSLSPRVKEIGSEPLELLYGTYRTYEGMDGNASIDVTMNELDAQGQPKERYRQSSYHNNEVVCTYEVIPVSDPRALSSFAYELNDTFRIKQTASTAVEGLAVALAEVARVSEGIRKGIL